MLAAAKVNEPLSNLDNALDGEENYTDKGDEDESNKESDKDSMVEDTFVVEEDSMIELLPNFQMVVIPTRKRVGKDIREFVDLNFNILQDFSDSQVKLKNKFRFFKLFARARNHHCEHRPE